MAFNHENLKVYQRTLVFNAKVAGWVEKWDSKHAICDHLPRAAASTLENIATGSAAYSAIKVTSVDYAAGSVLECAACIDLAGIKGLLGQPLTMSEKEELSQILKMLVGLRRVWSSNAVREEPGEYGVQDTAGSAGKADDELLPGRVFFHHETLDVYSVALQVARAFTASATVRALPSDTFRRLDVLLTSMVLNVAEGNGRFSAMDQRRFLGTSHEATIKMAARLDVCTTQGLLLPDEVAHWKDLLSRVAVMTHAMMSRAQGHEKTRKLATKFATKDSGAATWLGAT